MTARILRRAVLRLRGPRPPADPAGYDWIPPRARDALTEAAIPWTERAEDGTGTGPRYQVAWPSGLTPAWFLSDDDRLLVTLPTGERLHHARLGGFVNLLALAPTDTLYRDRYGTTSHPTASPSRAPAARRPYPPRD